MVDEKVPSIKGTGDGAGRLKSDLNKIFSGKSYPVMSSSMEKFWKKV